MERLLNPLALCHDFYMKLLGSGAGSQPEQWLEKPSVDRIKFKWGLKQVTTSDSSDGKIQSFLPTQEWHTKGNRVFWVIWVRRKIHMLLHPLLQGRNDSLAARLLWATVWFVCSQEGAELKPETAAVASPRRVNKAISVTHLNKCN